MELDHQNKMDITGSKVGSDISKLRIINEPDLYELIFKSIKPEAKAFKCWITHTVLPEIRRTGAFLHATEDMTDEEIMARIRRRPRTSGDVSRMIIRCDIILISKVLAIL